MTIYPWQQAVFDQIAAHDFQSLLLVAAPGQGVGQFARAVTQQVMCKTQQGCGRCPSCLLLAQEGHPDVLTMQPEGKSHAHKIDAVRQIVELAGTTTYQGGRRVIQIFEAERLNLAGANGLLKFLEEPPAGTHFILSTHLPGRLPATVLSRCRLVRVPSAPEDLSWLDSVVPPSELRDQALSLTHAPDLLLELVNDPDQLQARLVWRDALLEALQGRKTLSQLINAAGKLPPLQWLDDWYRLCVELARADVHDATRLERLIKFQARLEKERRPVLEQVTLNATLMLRALGSVWLRVAG